MDTIYIGQSVKIKRTDGRIHCAVVSKLNPLDLWITVEWFERGETKGKEVELQTIIPLNPDIAPSGGGATEHQQQASAASV